MEGAKITNSYKMGRDLEKPTHLVMKINTIKIINKNQDCFFFLNALLDAYQMAIFPTKPRLNSYILIDG